MIIRRINPIVPPPKKENLIECVAAEDIRAGTVIIKDVSDLAYTADIMNETHAHRTIGIATNSVYLGEYVSVQVEKAIKMPGWDFEFKKPVYIGDNGILTQVKPLQGFVQIFGIPYERDTIFVDIEPAILFNFYKPAIVVKQNHTIVSRNVHVVFDCENIEYSEIEWQAIGRSPSIHSGKTNKKLEISWGESGRAGVKVKIKDKKTGIWSGWSKIYYVEVK